MPRAPRSESKLVTKATPSSFYIPVEELKGFQELMGGIPRATILGALGAPSAGKSTLFAHLCAEVAKADKGNIVVFDTENKFHVFLELASPLSERYGLTINPVRVKGKVTQSGPKDDPHFEVEWIFEDEVDPDATNMFVIHCPNIPDISLMFGRRARLKNAESGSGKFKVIMVPGGWIDEVDEIPLSEFFLNHNCKVLLIDSVTNPTDEFPAVGENLPARTDLSQSWLLQVHKLAAHYNIPVLATFHETRNETNPMSKMLDIEGGKAVKYALAFILYLLQRNAQGLLPKGAAKPKKLARDMRAMYLIRHASPRRVPWKDVKYLRITETGLHDADADGSMEADEDDEKQD